MGLKIESDWTSTVDSSCADRFPLLFGMQSTKRRSFWTAWRGGGRHQDLMPHFPLKFMMLK